MIHLTNKPHEQKESIENAILRMWSNKFSNTSEIAVKGINGEHLVQYA